jgi:endogenous inhibitor of DNA gyrase (YacG/DUF329 family)
MNINWDYVAGFTDGEGYLGVIGKGPRIVWGQKDKHQLEVIRDFFIAEGLHPNLTVRRTRNKQPNPIWLLSLTRRAEVLYSVEILENKLVLKIPQCETIKKWASEHPTRNANMLPVDPIRFNELYQEGYTQVSIGKIMGHSPSVIYKFVKENDFNFKVGGGSRIVDGKRLPAMTDRERILHRRRKEKVGICPKCGNLMYKASKQCRACSNKNRIKRGKKDRINVNCGTCGKPLQKLESQLKHYPLSFCDKNCRAKYRINDWSKRFDCCIDCGTTSVKHIAKGRCKACHNKWYWHTLRKKSLSKT